MADTGTVADSVGALPLTNVAIFAGDGADTVAAGNNVLANQVNGEGDADLLIGGASADVLIDGPGADVSTGGAGNDRIENGEGNDTTSGGDGDDSFAGADAPDGADSFSGGPGVDSMDLRNRSGGLSISFDDVANDGEGCPATCEGDNYGSDVENVSSGSGNDVVSGNPAMNSIDTESGNDTVDGGGGNDYIQAGDGDDSLGGGDGDDVLDAGDGTDTDDGGPGDDYINTEFDDTGSDSYGGGAGFDEIGGGGSFRTPITIDTDGVADDGFVDPGFTAAKDNVLADIEGLDGGEGDDILTGNDADNEIEGGGGNDVISSGGGSDTIEGERGDDTINGGADSDTLDGGGGVDTLNGRDKSADQIDCGSSVDSVLADMLDEPEPSCESTSFGLVIAKSGKLSGKSATLQLSCPKAEGVDCKAKLTLKANGKTLGSGGAKIPAGKSKDVEIGLDKAPGNGKLHADASATFKDATGAKVTTKRKVTLG
jgi:Ca2+-binding RTX toxin-like protein